MGHRFTANVDGEQASCVWAHPTTGGAIVIDVPAPPAPPAGRKLALETVYLGCNLIREPGAHALAEGLMGHASVRTTQIHTHVLNRGTLGVRSPADG